MKHFLLSVCLAVLGNVAALAQTWTEPLVPAESLDGLKSSDVVYFYNVEADAFLINGMTWGTNACATRLTNGDATASDPQRCYAFVGDGKVRVRMKMYNTLYLSCPSMNADDVYCDQNANPYFAYTETAEGSNVYVLNNTKWGKDLDVTWDFGGHVTLVGGGGHTKWAFIKEENVTNGRYMAYKVKRQMYGVYKAVADAGKADVYAKYIADAKVVYDNADATPSQVVEAARTLFWAVYADVTEPVDVSFLFDDADMVGKGDLANWATSNATFGWGEFEVYHSAFTLSQTQSVPQGSYSVGWQALYREDGNGTAPQVTASGETSASASAVAIGALEYAVGNDQGNNWINSNGKFLPNGMQSCGQALAHDGCLVWTDDVKVGSDGKLTVSAKMTSAEQWLNWQRFVIVYKGIGDASVKDGLKNAIDEAEALYGDGSGKGAADLKAVLDAAKAVYADESASQSDVIMANSDLLSAIEKYRWASASVDNPVDVSHLIVNNSFESSFEGWTQTNMAVQSNTAFSLKHGNTYVEKWTSAGGKVGDGSVMQKVKGLGLGVYVLKAAAQNIQEGSSAAQKNAWVVANNTKTQVVGKSDYSVVFVNIENEATVGFLAEGATGNWISVDNFRLYYAGGEFADFKKELENYIETAKPYIGEKMHNAALDNLKACIAAAEAELLKDNAEGYTAVSTPLREAVEQAKTSIKAYADLAAAIAKAEVAYGDGVMLGAEKFLAVINGAKAVNDNLDATFEDMAAEIAKLEKAEFEYNLTNPTGTVPTVVTDKRYVRGAIAAFGRMTVSGVTSSEILEQGFCWSTEPNPTVLDNRTTKYLENNGRMYWMDMKPATVYYMRAYAITKGYAVGYGDVIKMSTLPQGRVTYWYNNGGDAAHNDRINTALTIATTYWSNYTSIRGFNVSCTFSPGTPTADCGYGGGMRIGTNMGQRAGTCMHEMNHGIGGGTLEIWGGWVVSPLRETMNGYWAGDRANEAVRFWENNDNLVITGAYDGGHWGVINKGETYSQDNIFHNKYPHNGAHLEPGAWAGPKNWNDTEVFYIGNSIINQGFCEDGLIPVNFYSGAFCLPAYVFEQDDNAKYYIKSESADRGLATSYLVEQKNGIVKWTDMTASDVTLNDSAAWYVSFTPDNQYYQFRNAATGRYLTFTANGANGIKTVSKATPAANEDFHLMKGRQDVALGNFKTRGYWIIHPEAKSNPATFTATANGGVAANTLDLYNSATAQRWIFLQADEIEQFETGLKDKALAELDEMISNVRRLKLTPHTEDVPGADATLDDDIATVEALAANVVSADEVTELIGQVRSAGMNFLGKATPTSMYRPFNITFLVKNAAIDDNSGWSSKPTFGNSCLEYFQSSFDFHQTITGLPAGTYQLRAKAFQRPGAYDAVYNSFVNGTDNVNTMLYAGANSVKVCNIASGARRSRLHADDVEVGNPKRYIPNSMASAEAYLKLTSYENEVATSLAEGDSDLKIGIKCTSAGSGYWSVFDNFRLYYYGTITPETVTAIDKIETEESVDAEDTNSAEVYNLHGQRVGNSLNGLPRGIYIVNKKKVFVR